ncbi:MAG TPA: DmsC/YnfH family molybdoenzyme membrane anchor subunit [Burkholderiales bacterium]|nr:DmsC/YnfH family molybdoenzyme membrane anchor subunit [Burkholderiales bacterium]
MRPAFSVILLTTLCGAGQGLFIAAFAVEGNLAFRKAAFALSALLAAGGLVASFFHLGRIRPAWRAASQWRTSWLSREVIALPVFVAGAALCGVFPGHLVLEIAVLAVCVALFLCTAMIYACLKFLQEWATPLTVANFFLLGSASGFTLAAALAAALAPGLARGYALWAIALTLLGAALRMASLARNRRLRPRSSLQSAIGIAEPRIRQVSQGFTAGSFNTHEFFHGASAASLRWVRWGFLLFAFAVPTVLLGLSFFVAAFVIQYAGLLLERWYFFAEANHPQNLYYQRVS